MLITHPHLKSVTERADERSATVKNPVKSTLIDHFEQAMNAPQEKTATQLNQQAKQQNLQEHDYATETAEKNEADPTANTSQNPVQSNVPNKKQHNSAPSSLRLPANRQHNKQTASDTPTENSMQSRRLHTNIQQDHRLENHLQVSANAHAKPASIKTTLSVLKDNRAQEGISASHLNPEQPQSAIKAPIGSKQPVAVIRIAAQDKQALDISSNALAQTLQTNKPVRIVDERPLVTTLQSTPKIQKEDKPQDINLSPQKAPLDSLANTPGNIILANLKTPEPMDLQRHQLISQLIDKVQILIPSLSQSNQGQNRVQLVLEQGLFKGTEITISLQNNQLSVTLTHSTEHAQLLQHARPELLERLQKLNPDQQVRLVTSSQEQAAENRQQDQGQQQESSQKSRVFDTWLEEQENA